MKLWSLFKKINQLPDSIMIFFHKHFSLRNTLYKLKVRLDYNNMWPFRKLHHGKVNINAYLHWNMCFRNHAWEPWRFELKPNGGRRGMPSHYLLFLEDISRPFSRYCIMFVLYHRLGFDPKCSLLNKLFVDRRGRNSWVPPCTIPCMDH